MDCFFFPYAKAISVLLERMKIRVFIKWQNAQKKKCNFLMDFEENAKFTLIKFAIAFWIALNFMIGVVKH